jgi:hypothetical protein
MWPPGGKERGRLDELERMRLALESLERRLSVQRPSFLLALWRAEAQRRARTAKSGSVVPCPCCRDS